HPEAVRAPRDPPAVTPEHGPQLTSGCGPSPSSVLWKDPFVRRRAPSHFAHIKRRQPGETPAVFDAGAGGIVASGPHVGVATALVGQAAVGRRREQWGAETDQGFDSLTSQTALFTLSRGKLVKLGRLGEVSPGRPAPRTTPTQRLLRVKWIMNIFN